MGLPMVRLIALIYVRNVFAFLVVLCDVKRIIDYYFWVGNFLPVVYECLSIYEV